MSTNIHIVSEGFVKTPKNQNKAYYRMVNQYHAAPQNLNDITRKFHRRNIRQILPIGENPSEFVIYWTPNGNWQGGTKTALECAKFNGIPTFSMYHLARQEILKEIEKLNFLFN